MDYAKVMGIIAELQNTASNKEKLAILKNYQDVEDLRTLCKYAYDTVNHIYGVTYKKAMETEVSVAAEDLFAEAEDFEKVLAALCSGELTGHRAIAAVKKLNESLCEDGKAVLKKILDHDIDAGVSTSTINKIWKGLIPKPSYCRCSVFSPKALKKVSFPAIVQLKCDGTYREAYVNDGRVTFKTRSGEPSENPVMAKEMANVPDGYYTGEFTVGKATEAADRQTGNGLINSDNPPFEEICFTVWDHLTEQEYFCHGESRPYAERLEELSQIMSRVKSDRFMLVPSHTVENIEEAMKISAMYMEQGLEGTILKDPGMIFKNGTSTQQFKIKLKVDCEMRITGFAEGKEGKRAGGIGSIKFRNDEGTIEGQCSGFSDEILAQMNADPDAYIGKIISVEFNDLMKGKNSETYALSHPRFIEFRNDKNETDTLEKVLQMRNAARALS